MRIDGIERYDGQQLQKGDEEEEKLEEWHHNGLKRKGVVDYEIAEKQEEYDCRK